MRQPLPFDDTTQGGRESMILEGATELSLLLRGLPDDVYKNVVRAATRKSANVMLRAARRRAKAIQDSGLLAASLGIRYKFIKKAGIAYAVVGVRRGVGKWVYRKGRGRKAADAYGFGGNKKEFAVPANYVHLVEYGTQPHKTSEGAQRDPWRNRKSARRWRKRDWARIQGTGAMHPGSKAKPFLRPAFEEVKARVFGTWAGNVTAAIKKKMEQKSKKSTGGA
jgi:HK97 gp10 family phage protein